MKDNYLISASSHDNFPDDNKNKVLLGFAQKIKTKTIADKQQAFVSLYLYCKSNHVCHLILLLMYQGQNKKNKRTNNIMVKRKRTKGQTI
jgi:hypothetical protein